MVAQEKPFPDDNALHPGAVLREQMEAVSR